MERQDAYSKEEAEIRYDFLEQALRAKGQPKGQHSAQQEEAGEDQMQGTQDSTKRLRHEDAPTGDSDSALWLRVLTKRSHCRVQYPRDAL